MPIEASTELRADACTMRIERADDGGIVVIVEGHDVGAFGELPLRCVEAFMPVSGSVVLTIDARGARGATMQVSESWARWLDRNRGRLSEVRMHVASAYVGVTADFVRRFAGLGELMRIERHGPAARG